jgi:NAD(P)-dependent dehydrogenase (short-subunit alcohol dehydrogenase family)
MIKRVSCLLCAAILMIGCTSVSTADTVLITGANSGLGLELAKQYAAGGWDVIVTHRREKDPESLTELKKQFPSLRIERLEVTDQKQVEALGARLKGVPIDVLISNAGVIDINNWKDGVGAGQRFGELDFDTFLPMMDVNVRGSIMVMQTLIENVKASKQKKIITMSSTHGSIGEPIVTTANALWYGASKAALNKLTAVIAKVVAKDGVIVVPMHPGQVRVDGGTGPLPAGMTEAPYACGEMIKTIAALTMERSGHFTLYNGKELPW